MGPLSTRGDRDVEKVRGAPWSHSPRGTGRVPARASCLQSPGWLAVLPLRPRTPLSDKPWGCSAPAGGLPSFLPPGLSHAPPCLPKCRNAHSWAWDTLSALQTSVPPPHEALLRPPARAGPQGLVRCIISVPANTLGMCVVLGHPYMQGNALISVHYIHATD